MSIALKFLRASSKVSTDQSPDPFSFSSVTDVARLSTQYTSTTTITGLSPNYPVVVSCNNGEIDAGTSALSGTWESSKTVTTSASGTIVVRGRMTASSTYYAYTSQTVTVGSGNATWTARTEDIDLSVTGFAGTTSATDVTPTAAHTFSALSMTGLSPSADYIIYRNSKIRDYDIAAGGSSVGTFTTNTVEKTFTATAAGEGVFQIKADVDGYWYQNAIGFYLKSPYSGIIRDASTAYRSLFTVSSERTYSTDKALAQSAPAGSYVDWEFTFLNLPTADGITAIEVIDYSSSYGGLTGVSESPSPTSWSSGLYISSGITTNGTKFYVRSQAPSTVGNTSNMYWTLLLRGQSYFAGLNVNFSITAT